MHISNQMCLFCTGTLKHWLLVHLGPRSGGTNHTLSKHTLESSPSNLSFPLPARKFKSWQNRLPTIRCSCALNCLKIFLFLVVEASPSWFLSLTLETLLPVFSHMCYLKRLTPPNLPVVFSFKISLKISYLPIDLEVPWGWTPSQFAVHFLPGRSSMGVEILISS